MSTFERAWGLSLILGVLCFASAASASPSDVVIAYQAYLAHVPEPKGDATCQYGDADCNRCMNDVRGTFEKFKNLGREDHSYWLRPDDRYEPQGITGEDINVANAWNGHVQTFARLPIDLPGEEDNWYVVAHSSDSDAGYLYFVSRTKYYSTPGGTRYAYRTPTSNHPGGVQGIGHYLLVPHELEGQENGEHHSFYEVYDVSDPAQVRRTANKRIAPGHMRVANVSGARLAGGGYLFASSYSSLKEDYVFFYAHDLETLDGLKPVGRTTSPDLAENLSMVTECGTGDLYVIGSTADGFKDSGGAYVSVDNTWTLFKVSRNNDKLALDHVTRTSKDRTRGCNARASGTAFVDADGRMHAFCHEKQLGDLWDRIEAGSVNFSEYWVDKPAYIGGAPGAGGGIDIPREQN